MPNSFAYLMLLAWPIIAVMIYRVMDIVPATFWVIVGGYMLLPVGTSIDLPFIPPLDKSSISTLSALFGCMFIKKFNVTLLPRAGIERLFVIVIVTIPIITTFTNMDPVFDGEVWQESLSVRDAFSSVVRSYLLFLPFILGSQIITKEEDLITFYKLLMLAGLIYSLPILFEIRMSPKLHDWIYGFFPHSWGQQYRFGGFRPVVFMGHGLLVAMFITISLGSALILWKKNIRTFGMPPVIFVLYLTVILILCKTIGALFLGFVLLFLISFFPLAVIKRLTYVLIACVIIYPLMLITDIFPSDQLIDLVASFNADRAQSLAYRFYNEGVILQHTMEKFLFGWGGWGRSFPNASIPDGYWIIVLSVSGFVGFVAVFGLSIIIISKIMKASSYTNDRSEFMVLIYSALFLTIIMIDQLPNHSLHAWLWLFVGMLLGRANLKLNRQSF